MFFELYALNCKIICEVYMPCFNMADKKNMTDRGWMYSGWKRGRPSNEWVEKTNEFLDLAFSMPNLVESDTIKCPCSMC